VETTVQKWSADDHELDDFLIKKQVAIREALCDNFDTPRAVQELFELVG